MRIYTRTGDLGETGLHHGPRVGKDMPRMEVCGSVDELNAQLGVALATGLHENVGLVVKRIQGELFEVGAELATPDPERYKTRTIDSEHIQAMERDIDVQDEIIAPLKHFILPGGSLAAAQLHLARTVCRRAERQMVRLIRESEEDVSRTLLAYLNRLGDLLFVLARAANHAAGEEEPAWHGGGS